MNIERITGDYIVLSSEDEFKALQDKFNKLEKYSEKLNFWQKLSYFKEQSEKGTFPPFSITFYNAFVKSYDAKDDDKISILPSLMEERTFLYWLIDLPDAQLIEWEVRYDAFDNITAYAEKRVTDFYKLWESNRLFQQAYLFDNSDDLSNFIDECRAEKPFGKMNYTEVVNSIRYARKWKSFLKYIGYEQKPGLIANRDEKRHKTAVWLKDDQSLVLLVKLLHEKEYFGGCSLREAFDMFAELFGKKWSNPHGMLSKIFDRNSDNYKPELLTDLISGYKALREKNDHNDKENLFSL